MNDNLTELVYILDMSGSMGSLADDTIGGYNSLLNEQKKLGQENPALRANVTTVLFDDQYVLLHDRLDIKNVPDITDKEYCPRGMTAMLDAIGRTLTSLGQKLAAMPEEERPGLVSVTIITDGLENSSVEYDWNTIHSMIKEQREKYSWVFSFIGANIDVEKTGDDLGIDRKMSKKFTASKRGTASLFSAVASGASAMRCCISKAKRSKISTTEAEDAMADALNHIE